MPRNYSGKIQCNMCKFRDDAMHPDKRATEPKPTEGFHLSWGSDNVKVQCLWGRKSSHCATRQNPFEPLVQEFSVCKVGRIDHTRGRGVGKSLTLKT